MSSLIALLASFGFLPALLPLASRLAGRGIARRVVTSAGIVAGGTAVGNLISGGNDGGGSGRRRRRRRALTASDRADIAFIQATISKAAADRFAQQIVASRV